MVFQEEIVLEQGKFCRNPEIGFIKVDKNGDLKNRVRIEMNQLDLVMVQKVVKEITDWKTKPTLEEGGEHHNFICGGCWDVLADGRVPLQHLTVWEKMARDKLMNLIFVTNRRLE
jgi:hypothetical protein